MKKIIAVDFDGTLCEEKYPLIGKPKTSVIEYVKELMKDNTVILWTCRRGMFLSRAVRWCKSQGLVFDYINENPPSLIKVFNGDCRKVFADIYIDDRAVNVKDLIKKGENNE